MQIHQCICGLESNGHNLEPCAQCESKLNFPVWNVINSKGKVVGEVIEFNHNDALKSASEYYSLMYSLSVRPKGVI